MSPAAGGVKVERQVLAGYIDHTLLKPDATGAQIKQLCDEALEHSFRAVCVNSRWVGLCAERLAGSAVAAAVTVGFPLGAVDSGIKAAEAAFAVEWGAAELDMVIDIGAAREGEYSRVCDDIAAVRRAAGSQAVLKVIVETALLSDEQIVRVCGAAEDAGANMVKTSTGFAGGATVEHVALLRRSVSDSLGVKASGGIRTYDQALAMIEAGATRIGTSAGAAILQAAPG